MLSLSIRTCLSRAFLSSRFMLWTLFAVNVLGTIYGYQWYWKQLLFTAQTISPLYLPFVPDSPTASLFFTGVIAYLLMDSYKDPAQSRKSNGFRSLIEALAVITSFKYGVWAVSMIWAGAYQGDSVNWQDWMLTISHFGMAAEAIIYIRLYTYRVNAIIAAALWTLWNDYIDYVIGVFPWLPTILDDDLPIVASYTVLLSFMSIMLALILMIIREFMQKKQV